MLALGEDINQDEVDYVLPCIFDYKSLGKDKSTSDIKLSLLFSILKILFVILFLINVLFPSKMLCSWKILVKVLPKFGSPIFFISSWEGGFT